MKYQDAEDRRELSAAERLALHCADAERRAKLAELRADLAELRRATRKPTTVVAKSTPTVARVTPTAASRPQVRRTRAQASCAVSSSDDPDPPLGPGVVAIAAAARLIREGQQLSLWADRP